MPGQVSEVRQEGDLKFLYKLKVDESAAQEREILIRRLTEYRKQDVATSGALAGGTVDKIQSGQAVDTAKSEH